MPDDEGQVEEMPSSDAEQATPAPEDNPILEGQEAIETPELQETETPAVEEESPAFVSQLSELGFEGVETEEQGRERLLESYRQTQAQIEEMEQRQAQLQQLAEYGNQYLETLRSQPNQQQTPSTSQSSAPSEDKWWSPPEFEQAWLDRYREQDPATGEVRWKEGTPANVRAQTQSYQDYLETWADNLSRNPDKVLPPVIEKVAGALFERMYEDRRTREQEEQFYDRIRSDNTWMYEVDPRTNQPTDRFSAEGQRMVELLQEAADLGISQSNKQWDYAHRLYQAEHGEPTVSPQSIAARATAEQKRQQHVRRAAAVPNRAGSRPAQADTTQPTRNVNNTRGQDLLQDLEAAGIGIN